MKKRYYLLICLISILSLGLLAKPSFSIVNAATSYNNYVYDKYHIDMVVDENNICTIKEEITVTYGDPINGLHKGWVRAIPKRYEMVNTYNGKTYRTQVSPKITLDKVGCTHLRDYYYEDNFLLLELTDGTYVNSEGSASVDYVIKYTYDIGNDYVEVNDNFMFNIIGSDYVVPMNNVSFNVTFPKSFDASKVKLFTGEYGESKDITNKIIISGNTISASGISLKKNNGLTINVDLPEGYFNFDNSYRLIKTISLVMAIVCLVVVAVLSLLLKNHIHPVTTVEFYPPNDMMPAEAKFVINGNVTALDVSGVIVLWASKNYVKLNLDENKNPVSVTRLVEIPNTLSVKEQQIWRALFKNQETVILNNPNSSVGIAIHSVASQIRADYGDNRYEKRSTIKLSVINFVSILPMLIISLGNIILRGFHLSFVLVALMAFVGWVVANTVSKKYCNRYLLRRHWLKILLSWLVMIGANALIGFVLIDNVFSFTVFDPYYITIWGYIIPLISSLLAGNVLMLNKETFDIFGKVYGFKHNIEVVEKEKLKMLLQNDPSYFYHILPYAYVFGISKKFIDKFVGLTIPFNENVGTNAMETIYVMHHIRRTSFYHTAQSVSKTTSSFGGIGRGGRGGGGFSGGGHGGGGGRGL